MKQITLTPEQFKRVERATSLPTYESLRIFSDIENELNIMFYKGTYYCNETGYKVKINPF